MTSFIRRICFITEPRNGNEASNLNVLHENGNHGRADDSRYVAHHLASKKCMTETAYESCAFPTSIRREGHSPRQEVQIYRYLYTWWPHTTISKLLFGFLCRHVLGCLLDVHAHVDAFPVYNGMIYTKIILCREPHY